MRKLLTTAILILMIGIPAIAKDLDIIGCTADKHPAKLVLFVVDNASQAVSDNATAAFVAAAKMSTDDEIVSRAGYLRFIEGLSDETKSSVGVYGPPVVDTTQSCK